MSLLTEAEAVYRSQRSALQPVGTRRLRRRLQQAERRASGGDLAAKVRLAAVRDECRRRGLEVTVVDR